LSPSFRGREVMRMSTYETISLMIAFGVLLLTLVSLIIALVKAIAGTKK